MKIAVITISDSCYEGRREDKSGGFIKEFMKKFGDVLRYEILPDDKEKIKHRLISLSNELELIITTGGTGISPRDQTPEATMDVVDKEVPGISEILRMKGYEHTPFSVISRSVCGIRGKCLIINLPGSLNAVKQSLKILEPIIPHALDMLSGKVKEHDSNCSKGN